jgi:hypothetical protein
MAHTDSLFFHEDFYKQIELVPRQNYFATQRVIAELPHEQEPDEGFLTCVVRPEHPVRISDEKITLDQVNGKLKPLALSYHDQIVSGYSNSTYEVPDAIAWGFERFGIFVESKGDTVTGLWLCRSTKFSADNSGHALKEAIMTLSSEFSLVLVDWNQEILVDTSKERPLRNYLIEVLRFNG